MGMRERALQKKYGLTQNGKFVDLKLLDQLKGMGVEKEIAIEALRQTNNAGDDTLNLCLDPQRKEILAQTLYSRYFNDKYLYQIEQILSVLGSDNVTESRARAALFISFNDVEQSINMLSAPNPTEVVDLDRIEARFIPFVQQRQERILREQMMAEKQRKLKEEKEKNSNDMNVDDAMDKDEEEANNCNDNEAMMIDGVDENDDLKKDEKGNVVDPVNIKAKPMPNPNIGDVNDNDDDIMSKLVDDYKPIQRKLPDEDDMKIEQHILDDLDNDDESYLDIDLTKEQDALTNLKVLLNSMQIDANSQDDQQPFLSLFKK